MARCNDFDDQKLMGNESFEEESKSEGEISSDEDELDVTRETDEDSSGKHLNSIMQLGEDVFNGLTPEEEKFLDDLFEENQKSIAVTSNTVVNKNNVCDDVCLVEGLGLLPHRKKSVEVS